MAPQDSARVPDVRRFFLSLLVAEALQLAMDAVLVWTPLLLALDVGPFERRALRVALPVSVATYVASLLRLADGLRPVVAVMRAKQRQGAIPESTAVAAERALGRIALESAVLRLVLHGFVAGALVVSRGWPVGRAAAIGAAATVVVLHGLGSSAFRGLVLERLLEEIRPAILPNLDRMRLYAARYRGRLVGLGVLVLGTAVAGGGLLTAALGDLGDHVRQASGLLVWPVLAPSAFFWARSLVRRLRPVEAYFEATQRRAGGRGLLRDEPSAVPAFVAAQSLPYRLALYEGFALLLAFVAAVAVGRWALGFGAVAAGRLLLAHAVVVVVVALYQVLLGRSVLRPLLRHLGSRHHLPIGDIRSRVGLGPKLAMAFAGLALVGGGFAVLMVFAWRARDGLYPAIPPGVALPGIAGLVFLMVEQLKEPLAALESRSEEMARGELARPVPPAGEADEIGRLTVAFEEMRRSLRDKLRSTESINIDLEREVRRRTEVLEQRNVELRDALDKLRKAQDSLLRSEKLASMGRLVAGIAHEINNPVNAVINSLAPLDELVRDLPKASNLTALEERAREAQEILAVVQRGATRTKAIVQALHNYSRSDETTFREVNLARSVDDTLDLVRHRLRNVTLDKAVDPEARIQGLPGQIDQVLMNLVTNAAQALGDKGGTIRVGVERQAGGVVVTVSDDGPGIPADVLPRIFDPFFTTKDVGEGSGLGLSIVHGIVERHGGRIEVDTREGVGTTFRITFPRATGVMAAVR